MITRKHYLEMIRERLKSFPVVSVLGPRQVGKTTLAQEIAGEQPSHFFDLEDVDALARLFVVHPGKESYVLNEQTEAVAITNLRARLAQAGVGGEPI